MRLKSYPVSSSSINKTINTNRAGMAAANGTHTGSREIVPNGEINQLFLIVTFVGIKVSGLNNQ
jgi:hypothetical protein